MCLVETRCQQGTPVHTDGHRLVLQKAYLEHHLELCREGEEGTQHGPHGHEHELKEQQTPQVVGACHCVGLPRL